MLKARSKRVGGILFVHNRLTLTCLTLWHPFDLCTATSPRTLSLRASLRSDYSRVVPEWVLCCSQQTSGILSSSSGQLKHVFWIINACSSGGFLVVDRVQQVYHVDPQLLGKTTGRREPSPQYGQHSQCTGRRVGDHCNCRAYIF